MTIEFIISFLIFALAACGLGNLYLYLIQPNQLLSFVENWLSFWKDKNVFIYKSIGGCGVCTIQRFGDLSYILLMIMFKVNVWYILPLYCLYGGLIFFFNGLKSKPNPIVNSKTIDL